MINNNFVPSNQLNGFAGNIPQMNPYQEKVDRYMNLAQQQNILPQNSSTNMNFIVVENIQKAKEQIVPYGYTMWMRDASEPYQYIKSVDQVGTPTFKVLKVEDVTDVVLKNGNNLSSSETNQYVSLQEFEKLNNKVEQLQSYCNNVLNQISPSVKQSSNNIKNNRTQDNKKVGGNNEQ